MKVRNFNIGVESITRWQRTDEVHLPIEGQLNPEFSDEVPLLDQMLRPPMLNERLPLMMTPDDLERRLLEPTVMSATKETLLAALSGEAKFAGSTAGEIVDAAITDLKNDIRMDDDIRSALVALFRG